MGVIREVAVPDIGDFADVPVIEILVSPGDEVGADAPLVTLESDKATMDVPAPFAGRVVELKVKLEDKVSEGTPLLTMEPSEAGAISTQEAPVEAAVVADEQEGGGAPAVGDTDRERPSPVPGSAPSAGPRVPAPEPPATAPPTAGAPDGGAVIG